MPQPARADQETDEEYLARANRIAARLGIPNRYILKDVLEPVVEREHLWEVPVNEDGWSDWSHPLPGYRIQCCDCELIHEMEFAIVPLNEDVPLNDGEDEDHVVVFRARRAQGTEARRAEPVPVSVHDGPVAESDAPRLPPDPPQRG